MVYALSTSTCFNQEQGKSSILSCQVRLMQDIKWGASMQTSTRPDGSSDGEGGPAVSRSITLAGDAE